MACEENELLEVLRSKVLNLSEVVDKQNELILKYEEALKLAGHDTVLASDCCDKRELERYQRELRDIKTDNIPIAVNSDRGLSASAKVVYGAIYTIIMKSGRKSISMPEINRRTNISKATITRCVEQLEHAGWIGVVRYNDDNGHRRNSYRLNTQQLIDRQNDLLGEKNPYLRLEDIDLDAQKE